MMCTINSCLRIDIDNRQWMIHRSTYVYVDNIRFPNINITYKKYNIITIVFIYDNNSHHFSNL